MTPRRDQPAPPDQPARQVPASEQGPAARQAPGPSPVAGAGPRRILVVCLGNYCRSPLAALVLAQRGGPGVEIRSAGLRGKWAGKPAHPAMVDAAARRGLDLRAHRGTRLTPELMRWADRVLAMDHWVLRALRGLAPDPATAQKIHLYLGEGDVPDPYGLDAAAFDACAALIEEAAARHLP